MNNANVEPGRILLRIHGMDCAEEVTLLKRELLPLLGDEERLGFDLLNRKLTVETSSLSITRRDVLAAIARTGLNAEDWQVGVPSSDGPSFWQQHQRWILTTMNGLFGLGGLFLQLVIASEAEREHLPWSMSCR